MAKESSKERSTIWERHKLMFYKYGYYYATICGLVMINYMPARPTNTWSHRLAVVYSYVLGVVLVVVMPIYFCSNITDLIQTDDCQIQLHLWVTFANTMLKYFTFVLTYIANLINYHEIRNITTKRQRLEDIFGLEWSMPRQRFEFMLLFKFGLINSMMIVQWTNIAYQYWLQGSHSLRGQLAIYAFVLWNYTENMSDYLYYMITSSLKFYRQLQQRLQKICQRTRSLTRLRAKGARSSDFCMQFCCGLCDRLDELAELYKEIYALYMESIQMQKWQMFGLVFSTLLSNLANLFTLFTLFTRDKTTDTVESLLTLILSGLHAVVFYADAYAIIELSEQVQIELELINLTSRSFNEFPSIDARLEKILELFSMSLMHYKSDFHIFDMFRVKHSLVFSTGTTIISYFISLIQLALDWKMCGGEENAQ